MRDFIRQFTIDAQRYWQQNKQFISRLKRKKPKNLDEQFHELHDAVFAEIDCLECANCCKTTSPIFYQTDIDRLARQFKMNSSGFIDTYLTIDDDGDYVLKSTPCPFLSNENECMVYDNRPKACREYPHTDRKKMHQILDLTLKNTQVCPATLQIVRRLHQMNQSE